MDVLTSTPYVDPQSIHNPSVGGIPPASWGDTVRNGLEFLIQPPSVCAVRSADQTISNATATAVQFNTADAWDTDAFHDPASNNTRLTVPSGLAGRYVLLGQTQWASHATGSRVAWLYLNGAVTRWEADSTPAASNRVQVHGEVALSVGDYVEMFVYQSSGGSLVLSKARLALRWVSR